MKLINKNYNCNRKYDTKTNNCNRNMSSKYKQSNKCHKNTMELSLLKIISCAKLVNIYLKKINI